MSTKLLNFILIVCLSLPFIGSTAQNYKQVVGDDVDVVTVDLLDKLPEFKGGNNGLIVYLSENIRYPEIAQKEHAEGRAIVEFVIDEKGKVVSPTVKQSAGYDALDAEAVRVIRKMPHWKPGIKDGKPVRVKYTIPINFAL